MTPSEGKDSDSSHSRKTFIIIIFTYSVNSSRFVLFSFLPPSVVVVLQYSCLENPMDGGAW